MLGSIITTSAGIELFISGTLSLALDDGTDNVSTSTVALDLNTWYHAIIFVDRSGNAQWYLNGVASGSAPSVTTVAETLTVANTLMFGANGAGAQPSSSGIAYLAMWLQDAWLDTHLQATVAQERFNRLIGIHPSKAEGTAIPT
ncbi:hypothetical protein LCGC14_2602020, partial [marine sediment metagenome]